jgi:cobyrinic acid a,c-diamide synthase
VPPTSSTTAPGCWRRRCHPLRGEPARTQGELRGHTFHHGCLSTPLTPTVFSQKQTGTEGEPIYQDKGLVASFFHGYFPSAPQVVADIFNGHFQAEAIFSDQDSLSRTGDDHA